MNEDTIPAQLGPMTVPAALGSTHTSLHGLATSPRVSHAFKWLIGTVAAALLVYLAR